MSTSTPIASAPAGGTPAVEQGLDGVGIGTLTITSIDGVDRPAVTVIARSMLGRSVA